MRRLVWDIPGLDEALTAVLQCYPLGHYRYEASRLDGAGHSRATVSTYSRSQRQLPPAVRVLEDLWQSNGWTVRIEARPLRSPGQLVGGGVREESAS